MKLIVDALPNASKNLEKNIWADYVELLCLINIDHEISLSDLTERSKEEEQEENSKEEYGVAEKNDRLRQHYADVFRYIITRSEIFQDDYPFELVDEDTIGLRTFPYTIGQQLYLFLLFASNLSCFSKTDRDILTKAFESMSREVLQLVYPQFTVNIFGTSRDSGELFSGGNLIERLKLLADCLNTTLTESALNNPRYKHPSGDRGIDLVGFAQVESDKARSPFIPAWFAQCACSSEEWKGKQYSVQYETIRNMFNNLSHYSEFIVVPFSLRGPDGRWADTEADNIVATPIDRVRFLQITALYGRDNNFFESSVASQIVADICKEIV